MSNMPQFSDYITPEEAVEFYKKIIELLQGDDALIICPQYYGLTATACIVNAAGMRRKLDAEVQGTSEHVHEALTKALEMRMKR